MSDHRVHRSADDRVLLGVCGGWARRYAVDSYVVRAALLVLTLAGGLGVVLYLGMWLLSTPSSDASTPADDTSLLPIRSAAVALGTGGSLVVCRHIGVWPGDGLMVPAVVVTAGSAMLWFRDRRDRPAHDPVQRILEGRASPLRLVAGVALALAGVVALVARGVGMDQLPAALAAVAMAVAGVAVLVAPYVGRLTTQLRDEERARIRDQERNDMAAHLHDSVLQTLALMQRSAGDPRRLVMLARRQERELRSWLYDQHSAPSGSLSSRAEEIAAEVELDHQLPVDMVVVGDTALDERVEALLQAVREATINAAKHSRAELVTVYVEVEPARISAYVRDKGVGFDPIEVNGYRRGIAGSIRDRLARAGGTASLDTAPGGGTEWELEVPR